MYEALIRRRTLGFAKSPNRPPRAKEYATLTEPTENLLSFPQQSANVTLDEVLQQGAQRLLTQAVEDEVTR